MLYCVYAIKIIPSSSQQKNGFGETNMNDVPVIERILNINPVTEKKDRSYTFRASSLGKCKRLQLLESIGLRVVIPEDRKWIMKFGSIIHESVQESMKKEFDNIHTEFSVYNPELDIGGTIDVIIE